MSSLQEMKVVDLREMAKSRGLKGYSKLKKEELIAELNKTRSPRAGSPRAVSPRRVGSPSGKISTYKDMSVVQLKAAAKEKGLKGYSKMKRNDLIQLLSGGKVVATNIKSKRAKKDPNAPKRFLSAYFYYANRERPLIRSEHPDWKVTEVARETGRRWALLSESEKVPFQRLSDEDRVRYEREMRSYDPNFEAKREKRLKGKKQ